MSPLVFLAIPLAIFVIGSTALWLGSRWRQGSDFGLQRAPDDLRTVAPMLRDQRQTGWQSGVDDRSVRS
jgi:hypothetical protein